MAKTNSNGKPDDKSREQALDLAISQIEKQYGKGSIMRMGGEGGIVEVESIPSGALSIDLALGIGGFPRGRIVEIYGPEGAGKTMVSLHAIREAQPPSSTPNTPSISPLPDGSVSMSKISSSRSLIPANKPWKSSRRSCAQAPSISSSSIRWLPSCRRLNSRATWGTPTWGCTRGSCRRPCAS